MFHWKNEADLLVALSYACIAPLILIFAGGGMWFIRIIWKYNLIYVFDSTLDSKGLFYPRALLHLIVGLYVAEISLIGLFALNTAIGPLILMVMFLIITTLVHFTLSDAIAPLLQNLPQTLVLEEEIQAETPVRVTTEAADSGAAASYYDTEVGFGNGTDDETEEEDVEDPHGAVTSDRAVEGASSVRAALTEWLKATAKSKTETEAQESGLTHILSKLSFSPKEGDPPGFLARWLHPDDFVALRKTIPSDLLAINDSEDTKDGKYLPPELWLPKPVLWIPRDDGRVSRQEVAHSRKVVPISDVGASLNDRGRVAVDIEAGPLRKRRIF